MTRRLYPARLAGTVTAPPSKSAWHRALICRFLAGQPLPERVSGDDVKHTLAGLRALESGAPLIDCGDSGATLRFLLPLAMALGRRDTLFAGTPRLLERPLAAPYPVEKLDFYFVDSAERAKYLARVQDVRAWVVPCESAGVEINAVGVDKGSGLQALCRCLNIPISAAIAIGDSENDRPLLRDAGLPLAMGNAIADVKAAAQYVMPDCDHDGVAEAIERFLLAQS